MAGFGYDPIDEFDTKVQTVLFLCILDKIYMDWKLYCSGDPGTCVFNEFSVRSFLHDIGCINRMNVSFQAGGLERARKLPKIQDADKESMFGYVHAVSGPGKFKVHQEEGSSQSKPLTN